MRMRLTALPRIVVTAALVLVMSAAAAPPWADSAVGRPRPAAQDGSASGWVLPVGPPGGPAPVVRGFDPPAQRWLPGHRGVDLAAPEGSSVRAAASGVVVHAGPVAGVGVVSISHGDVRSTYQPVDASVRAGDRVAAGEPIGTLTAAGSHCPPDVCLHWGAVRGDVYVDPLEFLDGPGIRLLPLDDRAITEDPPPPGTAGLTWPVAQPYVTSPFGQRTHPITGIRKLHDGTDFRAPCSTPIRAAAPGLVTSAGDQGAYGLQVAIDHGVVGGIRTSTSSSHLSRIDIRPGQRVTTGQIVGRSGTTGLSTGCHLHFMVYSDGVLVDPMSRLPATTGRALTNTVTIPPYPPYPRAAVPSRLPHPPLLLYRPRPASDADPADTSSRGSARAGAIGPVPI